MRLKQLLKGENPFLMSAEGGEGEGGGASGGGGEGHDAVATAIATALGPVTKTLAGFQKELAGLKSGTAAATKLGEQVSALQAKLDALGDSSGQDKGEGNGEDKSGGEAGTDGKGTDARKRARDIANDANSQVKELQAQLKKMQTDQEKLQAENAAERGRTQKAEERRRESDKRRVLTDALTGADCIDVAAGLKLYRDDLEYDEEQDEWFFKDEDDLVTVDEGIKRHLPNYMKKARGGDRQGSGGRSPNNQQQGGPTATQLRDQAVTAGKLAKRDGNNQQARRQYETILKQFVDAGGERLEVVNAVVAG